MEDRSEFPAHQGQDYAHRLPVLLSQLRDSSIGSSSEHEFGPPPTQKQRELIYDSLATLVRERANASFERGRRGECAVKV